jgi:uncharacterized protein (TIGR03435 family)
MSYSAQCQKTPVFDVASVRPSKEGAEQRSNVPLDSGNVYSTVSAEDARTAAGGFFVATHQPLWQYIAFAYKLSGTQELSFRFSMFSGVPKSGAPFWVTGGFDSLPAFFDISARAPAETSLDQMRLMMRALLAERFHLQMHTVEADASVFALVLEKPGVMGPALRVHPASDTCEKPIADLPPVCGVVAHVAASAPGQHLGGRGISLALFASSIPTMTGIAAVPKPVVDQTGLTGPYDFSLTLTHDAAGDETSVVENSANFRDALKQQLGLRLTNARAPLTFWIVDHVEKPSEN